MNARLTSVSPFIEDDREMDLRIRISTRKVDWGSLSMSHASNKGSLNHDRSFNFNDILYIAVHFIQCLLEEDPANRMSLTRALRHSWLKTYTPLRVYDTISSLDPHDFSMLTSIPGFDISKSVTTNLKVLDLDRIPNGAGASNIGRKIVFHLEVFHI